ncbi:K+-transporting ATPase subunit C [Mycobacterium gordonae]|uniref:Potassium-transporting ATPase KdpC subunit n=1 Tax=Mycobacterium gordonae TaxID=1778 RepID=A0A0Q2RKA5_MYCGO|nr:MULTISPECIES: potassium-transporting ATPase subunit C [Mycobacterium]KQH75859.1 K+-transporting ATPase subunit C [Mycobacterium gordonae]MDP7732546.1 potassium-transporting ATPase subunit C [Mycobacterium sp. TY813]
MKFSSFLRIHWAAARALLVLTVITGLAYPLFIWLVAQMPGLHTKAEGSIVTAGGKPVGSRLIGQLFTDSAGNPLPQYFQSRPSAAGNGYDPLSSGASNLGPESMSLLNQVCSRSVAVGKFEQVDGSRPFCTGGGVGAVLAVIGPRDARGAVVHPTRVISVNEPCESTSVPFVASYEGVRVECAKKGEDYSLGQLVPIRGAAPADPVVPADAVSGSGSGLDPDISVAYADLQVARVARARHVSPQQVRDVLAQYRTGRMLGFVGEPCVNVLQLNLQLDRRYPVNG